MIGIDIKKFALIIISILAVSGTEANESLVPLKKAIALSEPLDEVVFAYTARIKTEDQMYIMQYDPTDTLKSGSYWRLLFPEEKHLTKNDKKIIKRIQSGDSQLNLSYSYISATFSQPRFVSETEEYYEYSYTPRTADEEINKFLSNGTLTGRIYVSKKYGHIAKIKIKATTPFRFWGISKIKHFRSTYAYTMDSEVNGPRLVSSQIELHGTLLFRKFKQVQKIRYTDFRSIKSNKSLHAE